MRLRAALPARLRRILKETALWFVGIAIGLAFVAALGGAKLDPVRLVPAIMPAITSGR